MKVQEGFMKLNKVQQGSGNFRKVHEDSERFKKSQKGSRRFKKVQEVSRSLKKIQDGAIWFKNVQYNSRSILLIAKLRPSSSSSWTELAPLSLFPSSEPCQPELTLKSIKIG